MRSINQFDIYGKAEINLASLILYMKNRDVKLGRVLEIIQEGNIEAFLVEAEEGRKELVSIIDIIYIESDLNTLAMFKLVFH